MVLVTEKYIITGTFLPPKFDFSEITKAKSVLGAMDVMTSKTATRLVAFRIKQEFISAGRFSSFWNAKYHERK